MSEKKKNWFEKIVTWINENKSFTAVGTCVKRNIPKSFIYLTMIGNYIVIGANITFKKRHSQVLSTIAFFEN